MSHFTSIKLELKDGQAISESLKQMGYSPEFGDKIQLQGMDKTRIKFAQIVVRKDSLSSLPCGRYNDLGFSRLDDGSYQLIADDMFIAQNPQWLQKFKQGYTCKVVEKTAAKMGARVSQEQLPDGSIRYKLTPKKLTNRR